MTRSRLLPVSRGHLHGTYQLRVDQVEELGAVWGGWLFCPGVADKNRRRESEKDSWRRGSASRVEASLNFASRELRSQGCKDPSNSLLEPECGLQPPLSSDWGCLSH